jgi:hypothetical protein
MPSNIFACLYQIRGIKRDVTESTISVNLSNDNLKARALVHLAYFMCWNESSNYVDF